MFIVTLERRSEQTLEREDFQLHGEFLFFFVVFFLKLLLFIYLFFEFVVACVSMESRGLGTQFVPSHTMHHSALHTHRGTFIQSTMPTE